MVRGAPDVEQGVHDRVELLLRRIPRLEQVVVQVDDVDGVDRGIGVGVRGQQHPPGRGEQVHRLLKEFDAVHPRHAVVGQDHRDMVTAQLELAHRVQRLFARIGSDDPMVLAVPPSQVPADRAGDALVIVYGDQCRTHGRPGRRHG